MKKSIAIISVIAIVLVMVAVYFVGSYFGMMDVIENSSSKIGDVIRVCSEFGLGDAIDVIRWNLEDSDDAWVTYEYADWCNGKVFKCYTELGWDMHCRGLA